jgi:hypothetical protein
MQAMQAIAHVRCPRAASERHRETAVLSPRTAPVPEHRRLYLVVLTWSFTFFSSARILAYLPTLWAILASGDASQHSLWTWLTWFGSNLTMAAWLYEQDGQRPSRAVVVNLCNAFMCAIIVVLVAAYRW